MTFDWEHIGAVIGGGAAILAALVVGFGKGAAHLAKDMTTAKASKIEGRLYEMQNNQIDKLYSEIHQLRADHKTCQQRLDDQEELISRLNLRIIDLTERF